MTNIDFCALGQLDHCKKANIDFCALGVVAIATVRRGYSDVQGFRHGYNNG